MLGLAFIFSSENGQAKTFILSTVQSAEVQNIS